MSGEEAQLKLGETTAEAVLGVLTSLCSAGVEKGRVSVEPAGAAAFASLSYPALATDASFTDGVSGANVFTITRLGARRLAAAMMFQEPPAEDSGAELDEIELSAVGEAMNQMMAAGAGALTTALGYTVDISVPTTRLLSSAADAEEAYPQTPYATSVSFTVLDEPCRLIQLIPNAFVVRMERALESGAPVEDEPDGPAKRSAADDWSLSPKLRNISVRVAAELGRATMSLEQAADPRPGMVIELNRSCDDAVDLCANGRPFATGELLLIDEREWAMRIERVLDVDPADYVTRTGGT